MPKGREVTRKPTKTTIDHHLLAANAAPAAGRIWCAECHSDEFILIEQARRRRNHGADIWDVDYTCMKCENFYGHLVDGIDVSDEFLAAMALVVQQPAAGRAGSS